LFTINLSAQTCTNALKNHKANNGATHWTTHGDATVNQGMAGNNRFQVTNSSSHFSQDVSVPRGSKSVYLGGWTRNSKGNAATGHAYLYGYVMDANDKILEYVQIGVQNKGTSWKFQGKKTALTSAAKKIRFFMMRSNINGQTDINNIAFFDNVTVSFNCTKKTNRPIKKCTNKVKNPQANNGENHWTSHGSVAVANLAGGNKSFKVMDSGAHFYQDINIPNGKTSAYIGGWTRNSQLNAPTGHAYLYAYVMDANDKILEYVQFGVTHTGMIWEYQDKKVSLNSKAKKIRLFLKKSAKNGVADTGNNAHFDNLIVTFNCKRKTAQPKQY
jgi:uncharacterized protein YfbU (UPF0304 family)